MADLYGLAGPVLRLLPPETAHRFAILALRSGLMPAVRTPDDPVLATRVWGLEFANPIGLSAGFDKDAEVGEAMLAAGFGFVEAGTVTPLPQPGNPRPRLFRLTDDRAVINRLGFNGGGLAAFAGRLAARRGRPRPPGPMGANVGRNKDTEDGAADYEIGIETLTPLADYLVINISSPNTPGLRALQSRALFEDLIARSLAARDRAALVTRDKPPLLVKIAPDLDDGERRDIAEICLAAGIDGLIVANTTIDRPESLRSRDRGEIGGLSGAPLFPRVLRCVSDMFTLTGGRIPIIGSGGVGSGEDAYAVIRAGASLVQLYSALVFEGPGLVTRIKSHLARSLREDRYATIADAVGADHQ